MADRTNLLLVLLLLLLLILLLSSQLYTGTLKRCAQGRVNRGAKVNNDLSIIILCTCSYSVG